MADKESMYRSELEHATGKIYSGDVTVMVYYLLKDSKDLNSLMEYLTGEPYKSDLQEEDDEITSPLNFSEWFSNFKEIE